IVVLLVATSFAYLRQYHPDIWAEDRLLLVWSLAVVLTMGLARALVAQVNPYAIPLAAGAVLIAVLLRPRLASYTAAVISMLVATVGTSVGVYASKRIVHRTDLMLAGAWVGGANAICILALNLMDQLPWYPDIATDAIYGSANGVIVRIIAIDTLPYQEQLFG